MDLDASVPTKQPLEVVQPAKGALDNTGSAEVGAGFGQAAGHLRCSVGSHVDPRTRNRRHRAFSHARRASDCDRLRSSTSSASQADACWDTTLAHRF